MSCEYTVVRAAASLPQTTTGTLFTVSGGTVLLVALVGEVTSDTDASPSTTGTIVTGSQTLWSSSVHGLTAGTLLGYSDSDGTTDAADVAVSVMPRRHLMALSDSATITFQTNHSIGGQIKWTAVYRPLDVGASVAAA